MKHYHYFATVWLVTIAALYAHNNHLEINSIDQQLIEAIENNNQEAVKNAIEQKTNVNCRTADNKTPLMIACINSFKQELIPQDMPKCYHGEYNEQCSWKSVYDQLLKIRYNIIAILIRAGAEVNLQDDEGHTALHLACIMNNDLNKVALLISAGADINMQTIDGSTALMEATKDGNLELVNLLLQANANVDIQDNVGNTALKIALDYRYKSVRDLLTNNKNVLNK